MRLWMIIAILLIAAGLVVLIYPGIAVTTEEHVVGIGPLEARVQEKESIPGARIAAILAIGGGVGLLIGAAVKRRTA